MNLRWLLLNHVPPGMELTPEERIELKRRVRELQFVEPDFMHARRSLVLGIMLVTVPLTIGHLAWIYSLIHARAGTGITLSSLIAPFLLLEVLAWTGYAFVIHRVRRPFVRRALTEMGKPVCLHCGYILLGSPSAVMCPECGRSSVIS